MTCNTRSYKLTVDLSLDVYLWKNMYTFTLGYVRLGCPWTCSNLEVWMRFINEFWQRISFVRLILKVYVSLQSLVSSYNLSRHSYLNLDLCPVHITVTCEILVPSFFWTSPDIYFQGNTCVDVEDFYSCLAYWCKHTDVWIESRKTLFKIYLQR